MTLAFVVLPQTPVAQLQRDMATWTAATFPNQPAQNIPAKTSGKAVEKADDIAQTILATQKTLSDIGTLCTRNPLICETGKAALVKAAGDAAAKMQAVKTELHP